MDRLFYFLEPEQKSVHIGKFSGAVKGLESSYGFIMRDGKEKLRRADVMARVELNVQAPDFTLNDFNGKSVSLSDYKNRKNVLVVFNRGFF